MGDMRYRRLGDSGLVVSVVGLGCNNLGSRLDRDRSRAVVEAALDAGITMFDTADVYGRPRGTSEQLLGEALGNRRDDVVVATKFGMDMEGANGPDFGARGSRRYVRRAVEASLTRLATDYIDLYQMHEPDPATPLDETLSALDDLVRDGLVRYVGSSNFAAWQVADAEWTARTGGHPRFVSAQNRYSLLHREAETELVPACERFGVGVVPFFPLEQGLLTGKVRRGEALAAGWRLSSRAHLVTDEALDRVEALERFAAERGVGLLDVAIGALAAQPAVSSVIAGASTPEQVNANVAAGSWQPTPEDLVVLDEIVPSPRSEG